MHERRKRNLAGRGERRKGDVAAIADALKRRGTLSLHVQGTGMAPLVQPGDIALIRRARLDDMRSGDVVLFQRGEQLVAKRIGQEDELKGEATLSFDVEAGDHAALPEVVQEFLGKIVRVKREQTRDGAGHKKEPVEALVSLELKTAR
jgi:phage repressor protein C with HTH and peptisase S24 domain